MTKNLLKCLLSVFVLSMFLSCGNSIDPNAGYKIVSKFSNKLLGVQGGSKDNNAAIVQGSDKNAAYQRWNLIPDNLGYYVIMSVNSGKCIDGSGGMLKQRDLNNSDAQKWILLKGTKDTYTIISKNEGRCFDLAGGSTAEDAVVVPYVNTGGTNQMWSLVR
jgi:endoglucanase